MTRFVTSRDGTRIAYQVAGSGEPVILVDGAFCYRGFGPMARLLSDGLRAGAGVFGCVPANPTPIPSKLANSGSAGRVPGDVCSTFA
jgi:hypothetical protein